MPEPPKQLLFLKIFIIKEPTLEPKSWEKIWFLQIAAADLHQIDDSIRLNLSLDYSLMLVLTEEFCNMKTFPLCISLLGIKSKYSSVYFFLLM